MKAVNEWGHAVNPVMVKLAREFRGFNQTEMAKASGLCQATIRRIEAGVMPISRKALSGLARATNMPPAFFFQTDTILGASVSEFCHYRRPSRRGGGR